MMRLICCVVLSLTLYTGAAAAGMNLPYITLTGGDSHIANRTCVRITTDAEWQKAWKAHLGTQPASEHPSPRTVVPDITFDRCMVLAVFWGATQNMYGMKALLVEEDDERILLGFDPLTYQTVDKADRMAPYAFFVLSRSDKPIVVQVNVQDLASRAQHGPPVWKEYCRLPALITEKKE